MGWQKRESAGLDSHDRIAVNRMSYTVYLDVLFLSKLSHNPNFFQIAPLLLDEACMKYRSSSSNGFQCVKNEEYIPVLVIGSDVPNFFLMKLNAKKCKEPRVCFVKRP